MRVMRATHRRSTPRWLTVCSHAVARTTFCGILLAASVVAGDDGDYATREPAIPAGQERIMAAMLGRGTLVRDCKFIGGSAEYTVIKATYNCPHGQVSLELGHLLDATGPFIQTGQFAVTLQSGSPPPGFEDALISRIRSRENNFVWIWPEPGPEQIDDGGDDGAE